MNFLSKREPNPPSWGRSWAAVFRENSKWWTKIHTRLSEEGHSAILLAHYIFLVLIEHKVIQQRRKIAQKCLLLLYNLHILASDQKKVLFLRATFEQLS